MMEFINALLGFNAAVIDRGRVVWVRLAVRSVIVLLILLVIGSTANYFGWKSLNLLVGFAAGVVGIVLALRPEGLVYSAELGILSGIASQTETVRQEVKNFLLFYARTAAKVLFWISGFFFILGTISIEENPWAVLGVLAAATVIFSYVVGFKVKFAIARRVIYAYTCFMLIALILSLVPRHSFIKWVGVDVKGFFATSSAELRSSRIEAAERDVEEGIKDRVGAEIERKIREGEPLNDIERGVIERLRKERDEKSWAKRAAKWFSTSKADAKAVSPPVEKQESPKRIAVLPTPPPPPPVAKPKKTSPFWEMCIFDTGMDRKARPICEGADVEFKNDRNEIFITKRSGGKAVFHGLRTEDMAKGEYSGVWRNPSQEWRYGRFFLRFESETVATGWEETKSRERFPIRLERMLPVYE